MIKINAASCQQLNIVVACVVCLMMGRSANAQESVPAALRGVVLTETGVPLPKAHVAISTAVPNEGPALFCPRCYSDCQKWTTTDDEGHFEIGELDTTLKFRLVISAPGYKTLQTGLLAPDQEIPQLKLQERPKNTNPVRLLKGIVRDEDGLPISGALISPRMVIDNRNLRSSSTAGVTPVVSDADGYFEMDLIEGVAGVDVIISAAGFCDREGVDFFPRTIPREFELLEGIRIIGRVETEGRPVSGMTVAVAPTYSLGRGEAFPQGPRPTVTDSEGRFELRNLAPGLEYCVYSVVGEANRTHSPTIIKTQKFVAPGSGETIDLGNLAVTEPFSFGGRVVRSDGEPSGDMFLRLNRDHARDLIKVPVASDGTFRIDGLPPDVYEIELASGGVELDPDKMTSLLWSKKSIKLLINKSDTEFKLPIRTVESKYPAYDPNKTQTISGRVTFGDVGGLDGIQVTAVFSEPAPGNSQRDVEETTTTSSGGHFTISGLRHTRVWLKLYRPDANGMVFWYLGMVQPTLNQSDITIEIGPEAAHQLEKLPGSIE